MPPRYAFLSPRIYYLHTDRSIGIERRSEWEEKDGAAKQRNDSLPDAGICRGKSGAQPVHNGGGADAHGGNPCGAGGFSGYGYPAFAKVAEEEGFTKVAAAFRNIAAIEACHASRFRTIEELLRNGALFDGGDTWMCLNCGHIHKGKTAPEVCPVCAHNRGYFLRTTWAPYTWG